MKSITTLACSLIISGCAATGVQVTQEAATQFVEGKTTETEIVAKLGQPTTTSINAGIKTIGYAGAQYKTNAASFIPVVGLFAGGGEYNVTVANYQIDASGILQKITYTTSSGTNRMGINPADVNARAPAAVK